MGGVGLTFTQDAIDEESRAAETRSWKKKKRGRGAFTKILARGIEYIITDKESTEEEGGGILLC